MAEATESHYSLRDYAREIEQLKAQRDAAVTALMIIHQTFSKDIEQGYRTKDKEFAIDIAAHGLKLARPMGDQDAAT